MKPYRCEKVQAIVFLYHIYHNRRYLQDSDEWQNIYILLLIKDLYNYNQGTNYWNCICIIKIVGLIF